MAVSANKIYEFGEWRLNTAEHLLSRSGSPVPLGPKVFDTLLVLVENAGRLVTKDEFMQRVWPDTFVEDLALTQNISQLRKILGNGDEPLIETVPKKGYRLLVPVRITERTEWGKTSFQGMRPGPGGRTLLRRVQYPLILAALLAALIFIVRRPHNLHGFNFVQITSDGQAKQGPIVTDGLRLYFGEGATNHRTLGQVSIDGGEVTALPIPLQAPYILDIAPNRAEFLVGSSGAETSAAGNPGDITSRRPLWLFSLPGGNLRRASQTSADAATWSADGSEIAFADDAVVYRARSDGSDAKEVARLPGTGSWLRWSPDGSRLRLTVFDKETGRSSLWEISLSAKRARPLLSARGEGVSECCGVWTPDGNYFVFESTRDGRSDIYALAAGKQEPVRLTSGQMNSLGPLVSPSGKKLYVLGKQSRGELSRYDSRAGQFIPYLSGISAEFVDFSKDRQWITYVTFPEQTLWRSRIDGSDRLQLTTSPMRAAVPQWSPDGKRIAFFDVSPGKPWKIFLISSDGGSAEPLLNESRNEMDPTWSPDGTSVAFSYFPIFERTTPDKLGIFVGNVNSRMVQKITGSDGLWAPRWSPDGRYIVARSADPLKLMLYDWRSQKWSKLVDNTYVGDIRWSSDGRCLYYSRRGIDPAILRIRISDGAIDRITDLKDVRQTGYRGGFWMGISPDDSPLVLRDVGTEEIYSLDLTTQ